MKNLRRIGRKNKLQKQNSPMCHQHIKTQKIEKKPCKTRQAKTSLHKDIKNIRRTTKTTKQSKKSLHKEQRNKIRTMQNNKISLKNDT